MGNWDSKSREAFDARLLDKATKDGLDRKSIKDERALDRKAMVDGFAAITSSKQTRVKAVVGGRGLCVRGDGWLVGAHLFRTELSGKNDVLSIKLDHQRTELAGKADLHHAQLSGKIDLFLSKLDLKQDKQFKRAWRQVQTRQTPRTGEGRRALPSRHRRR
ncbi:hypothetical protein T492DRAFT_1113352 [Pavlovales sp. CCMP2436]|nr:hypothetical protein T492DRAFT_1113352 [Pavlovales sp. CCMP2436]